MRKTKIVATIGPKSMDYFVFKKMVKAGLNIVRINLSHANRKCMEDVLANVKRAREEFNLPLPIMIDTRGPELRVKTFKTGKVDIKANQLFIFTSEDVEGDSSTVSINLPNMLKNLKRGDRILANNGLLEFKVLEVKDKVAITRACNSGVLSNRKSLCVPNVKLATEYLNKQDKSDILWAIKNNIDFVAISFVNSKEDVDIVRNYINKNKGNLRIISKIEAQQGVDNMEEIVDSSDGVMVARGDLGVEVAMEKLPEIQKRLINLARMKGKPVITATEMLESMIENPRPTRAEVSDVANSVYDGTSCVMLSGESANGNYPIEAVSTMASICLEVEKTLEFKPEQSSSTNISDTVSFSAVQASNINEKIQAIVCFTKTGLCASQISKFRPKVKVFGLTPNEQTYRQLDILWGVKPILIPVYNSTDEMFEMANGIIKKDRLLRSGEQFVVTCGTPNQNGGTNLFKIKEV